MHPVRRVWLEFGNLRANEAERSIHLLNRCFTWANSRPTVRAIQCSEIVFFHAIPEQMLFEAHKSVLTLGVCP
jgi:hypothetical protein